METRRTAVFWAILAAALVLMGAGTFLAALDTEKAGDASAG